MKTLYQEEILVKKLGVKQAALSTGWTRSLDECVAQLEAEVDALEARLEAADLWKDATPCAYAGSRVFTSENESSFPFNIQQTQAGTTNLVKYILRDGVTYDIPIQVPGPGVFCLDRIVVSSRLLNSQQVAGQPGNFEQASEFSDNQFVCTQTVPGITYSIGGTTVPALNGLVYTPKFCIKVKELIYQDDYTGYVERPENQPKQNLILVPSSATPPYGSVSKNFSSFLGFNYFWNLQDSKSGQKLSNDLMSGNLLGNPPRAIGVGANQLANVTGGAETAIEGGYLFQLDVPMLIERDGQLNFFFRPINPVLQLALEDPANTFAGGVGKEDQKVFVQVELHGYRLDSMQDYLRVGALSR